MGVIEKPSSRPGIVRFETNRVLTGTGHESYRSDRPVVGHRPADVLAQRLFERGGISTVHVNGNVVTVHLSSGGAEGIAELITNLYTYYLPGVEVPVFEETTPEE